MKKIMKILPVLVMVCLLFVNVYAISGNKNDTVNYNYSYDQDGRITDISTVMLYNLSIRE